MEKKSKNPEITLSAIAKQLSHQSRPSKDFLVKSLRQAVRVLQELSQLPSLKPFITPLSDALLKHGLLRHKDKDIRLLVAVSFCEIIRVLAPDPSFDDKVFKDIFGLFISVFMELADTASPFFSARVQILDTIATVQCCRRMLDLHCDDLIVKMFTTFFSVVREEHQQSLLSSMVSIMSVIVMEGEETLQPLLEVIIKNLIKKGEGSVPTSHHLAVALIRNCADKIKPAICGFLMSCLSDGESVACDLKDRYHDIVFELFQCTPDIILAIVPNLVEGLVSEQVDIRTQSVSLIGKLLSVPKDHDVLGHRYLFVELLKRFSDRSAEVRISVIRTVRTYYIANPSEKESHEIFSSLEGRLLDLDATVRTEAVAVVCDLGRFRLKSFPEVLLARVIDRLRDKMTSVRKEALKKLLEVYHEYCTKCFEGQMPFRESYEQIPCKILMLSLDNSLKEFRPQNMELLLSGDLFPASLPGEERMRHWIYLYSLFTPAHVKALNLVLCQKRRFQKEMRGYLSLCMKEKGIDLEEMNMRIKNSITQMSASFLNPVKAEESFCKLNELKDHSILLPLAQLLDEPMLLKAKITQDKYLKDIGVKNSLFEFLAVLSQKCSNNIFSSEHVRHVLDHISGSRCRDIHVDDSSFKLLSDVVRNFPLLLRDSEALFKKLMAEENSPICESLLRILAKAGPSISLELSEIYPVLERLCLEGTRGQSKAAISVIASSIGSYDQSLLVDLCQKSLESLYRGKKTPTVLQSLGYILQHSDLAFQQYGNVVSSYIRESIFEDETTEEAVLTDENSGCYVTSNCKLKIYALKTLVKSVLPYKGTYGEDQISNLLNILSKMLFMGEYAITTSACESDVAQLRLAAAKSVLRLSRRWDMHISPRIFQSTIMMAKDSSHLLRKAFLDKTHKLLKRHAVSRKFACAFPLAVSDCSKDLKDVSLKYLVDFMKEYGRASGTSSTAGKEGSMTDRPEYIVVFLLHALAHDAGFPSTDSYDEEHFAQFFRPLVLVLHVLVNSQFVDENLSVVNKPFLHLQSIFRAIRRAEDSVDTKKTPKLHMLADIGIYILNIIQPAGIDLSAVLGLVLLPSSLYRSGATKKTYEDDCSGRGLVNEDFVRKLVHNFDCDFHQLSSSTAKHGEKRIKFRPNGQNVADLLGGKQIENLRDGTTQRKGVLKEMAKTRVLEACPKGRKQTAVAYSSLGSVLVQDSSFVSEELEGDIENVEQLIAKDHQHDPKSANLELFEIQSDISTQELDVPLSVSKEGGWKKKSSSKSSGMPELSETKVTHGCSSDGSTVCFSQKRKHKYVHDSAEETVAAAEMQGSGNHKRKILVDKTNSLTANRLLKGCQPQKSCQGHQSYLDTTSSDISNENKDAIAFRTRRRRV